MNTEEILLQLLDTTKQLVDGQKQFSAELADFKEDTNKRFDDVNKRFDKVDEDIAEIKEFAEVTRGATNYTGEKLEELVKLMNELNMISFDF